ncbi:hypothetical protein [Flavobacterium sp. 3-210]
MPIQDINIGASPNDKTGDSARVAGQKINLNFAYLDAKVNNSNHVVTLGTSVLDGQDLTIHAGWVWQINGIEYTNPVDVIINFPFCSSGKQRLDRIVFNTSNTFTKVAGTESVSNPVATPAPVDTIEFGITLVTDGTVGDPSTPIEGGSYVKKMESQDFIASYGATTVVEQIDLIDDRSSILLTGAITDVKSIQMSGEFIRPGKPFFIKNATGHDVKLWHLAGTGNVKISFPNALDFTIKDKEVIQFKQNANDSSDVRIEYVGIDVVNNLTVGGTNKALSAEMGKTLDSTKQPNLTDAVFGAFQSVLPTVTSLSDTDKMPFLIGSVSRMMTWLNFKAILVATFFLDATSSIQTQLNGKQAKDDQIEISTNSNVLNAWHGQTVLFTASCTITVPSTLNNSLMFPFRTLAGVTVTWQITSPFTWETTPVATAEKTVGHFMRRGSTNTIFLDV